MDIEWDPDIVLTYRSHVDRIQRITDELLGVEGAAGAMDGWLESAFAKHLQTAGDAYEAYDLRGVAGELVYAVPETLRWYQRRGGQNAELLARVVRDWATALCPMLPHTAEEMFERAGGDGLCSVADFPSAEEVDESALAAEDHLRAVMEDIKTIAKLADVEAPESLTLFTTPAWKRDLTVKALEMAGDGKFPMGAFMGQVMQDPAMRELGKQVQAFTGKLPGQLNQFTPSQKALLLGGVDEADVLAAAAPYIQAETGAKEVHVLAADAPDAPDHPKRNVAAPLKPGIALE